MKTIEKLYYGLVSASWFKQWPNKKVTKIEIFYAWMSVAGFFGAWGLGNDVARGQEFSSTYTIMLIPFILGWVLKAVTVFGYKASKEVRDHFWETQLMRFLDPAYSKIFREYPHSSERLRRLKEMWKAKYGVTVEWTRANAPLWQTIQIVLMLGLTGLGLVIGLYL